MRRALLAATAAVMVVFFTVSGVTSCSRNVAPSNAPTTTHSRAVVLTASDDFAIYRVKASARNLNAGDYYGGDLFAISSTGHKRALPTFRDGSPGLALVRDTLVQAKNHSTVNSSYYTVHYLDLSSGREGTITLAPGDAELAAAPGGFVRGYRPDIATSYGEVLDLEVESYSGAAVELGTPYPDGRTYSVVAGDSGLIATTASSDEFPNLDATVRYMSWTHPGAWTTIYDAHRAVYLNCARPSASSVACAATDITTAAATYGVITLRTGKAVWLTSAHPGICRRLDYATYGSNLVAIETSSAGACTDGQLIRFGADGSFAASTKRYSGLGAIQAGLGEILASSRQQQEIDSLTGVTKQPLLVARASALGA
jgi:hypothetical protein